MLYDEARARLSGTEPLRAPDILAVEFANAMCVTTREGEIDEAKAVRATAAVTGRGRPQLYPSAPLVPRAYGLARSLDHPVHDCIYLALAEARSCPRDR